ncbi:SDR family NAD(P)-dependent oxidoreductase [Streptomyces sp. NPDC101150]|uniref:SDR family NAD(P)-dependent oxidoreductase n=1 Tax=Streptomyces sp. NPDC101150 TaxID=3366114 RepID=UPI0038286A39
MAVVTGAGRGIGRAIAVRLAADGYRLVLADIDRERVTEATGELPGRPVGVCADVRSQSAVDRLARSAAQCGRIDVWVNNAGVLPQGLLEQQETVLLEHTWQVNVAGTLHGCRAALKVMRPQGYGHIVNISSVCALKPLPGLAFYSATKAAVEAVSAALRLEVRGSGVAISTVLPYLADTAAGTGLRPRLLTPLRAEQVADAVAAVIRRPRARTVVPRPLGVLLAATSMLPRSVHDAVDRMLCLNDLAFGIDDQARAAYRAEVIAHTRHPPGSPHHPRTDAADQHQAQAIPRE